MKQVIFIAVILATTVFSAFSQQTSLSAGDNFNKGLALLRQNQFADALDAFIMSERLDPNNAATSANIGAAYMGLKKSVEAVKSFQRAIDLKPTEATFRTAICKAFTVQKDFDKAIAACKEGVRLAPESVEAAATLLQVMNEAKLPTEQLRPQIELYLSKFRDSVGILEVAANYYQMTGDLAFAAELVERITQLLPNDAFYFARLADIYLKLNREIEAVASARKSLALEPDNPFAQFFMGRLFFELGLNDEAADAFSKVVSIDPEFDEAPYLLSVSQKRSGKTKAALKSILVAVNRAPDNFEYQMELGRQYNDAARYADAVVPLLKAVALRSTDLEALGGLGLAYFESAQYDQAIPILEKADRLYPGNETIQMFLRVTRTRQAGVPRIPEIMETAKSEPDDVDIRIQLIDLLTFTGRVDEAEPYMKQVWKLAPKEIRPYVKIGVAYVTAGKTDKALDAFQRGLAVKEDPGIFMNLASLYTRLGDYEKASRAYDKTLEIKPDSPGIMFIYANMLRDSGKRREALDMYKRSLAIKAVNGPALFNAAVLSAKLGDMASAQQYLTGLKSIDPQLARKVERFFKLRLWQ